MWPTINREELKGQPSVHALIVGVSEYGPHLTPENSPDPPKGPPTYGMRSLTTPAASAAAVFRWLVEANARDLLPGERNLGTCRLLLAPSASEHDRLGLDPLHAWKPASQPLFEKAASDWRNDASTHADHLTFFYFAGHGLQLSPSEQVLLFPGFGNPDRPVLAAGVSLEEILIGMGPSDHYPRIARKQLYLVDSCRTMIEEFEQHQSIKTPQLWDMWKLITDYRDTVVFRTTTYGSEAYSIPNDVSVFARALLDCVTGLAGVEDTDRYEGELAWRVTATSLNDALNYQIPIVSTGHSPQQVEPSGKISNFVICRLPDRPTFPLSLRILPDGMDKKANFEICEDGACVQRHIQPFQTHPIATELPGGNYEVSALESSPPLRGRSGRQTFTSKSPAGVRVEWPIKFVSRQP